MDSILANESLKILLNASAVKKGQIILIELHMIEWIVKFFQDQIACNKSSFEYLAEILMFLILKTQGKKIATNPKLQIVKALIPLLYIDSQNIRSYVNGTFYCLLDNKEMKQEANVRFIKY